MQNLNVRFLQRNLTLKYLNLASINLHDYIKKLFITNMKEYKLLLTHFLLENIKVHFIINTFPQIYVHQEVNGIILLKTYEEFSYSSSPPPLKSL